MRRRFVKIAAIALAAAITVSAGACAGESGQDTFTGDASEEPEYQSSLNPITPSAYRDVRGLKLEKGSYISIIGKSEATAFWKSVRSGVVQAAEDLNKELGYTGNDKIKVTYNGPAKSEDIDEQVNILDEELSRYPDVIGIASIDEDACTVQFDLATENGIPIIALDSGNKYPGIQCTVKTDNQEAARTGAYNLANEIGGKGDVLVLVHDSKSETAKERLKSFQDEMTEKHPDVNVAEVIYCDKLDDIRKQMADEYNEGLKEGEREVQKESFSDADVIQYMIERHPGLKGIFGTNDSTTMLGLHAIRQAEEEKARSGGEDGQSPDESGEDSGKDAQMPEGSGKDSGKDAQMPEEPGKDSEEGEQASGESGEDSRKDGQVSGESGEGSDEAGQASGESGEDSGKDGQTPGESGEDAGKTVGASAQNSQESGNESEKDAQKQDTQADSENEDGNKTVPASADDDKNEGKSQTDGTDKDTSGDQISDDEDGGTDDTSTENEWTENTKIVLMGFDVSKDQLKALEEGEIAGLVVQNPFGIGYASVVAAARTVLQAGNEAQVSTGYLWVTKDNLNDESIKKMLYD
ncbi:substrate-binding domain-containing protein [Schaedlerella arabinosiphila]|uniref:substrate-binding domain-containing protein n=1 Tax=Schaedlerella arabinosiphila TaxID=2044587 RepID=UPI0025582CDE|nr:substrate-binding domain-containing protein [Schaedlerella arabinosiphila]